MSARALSARTRIDAFSSMGASSAAAVFPMRNPFTLVERDGATLRVTLNRPDKLNALSLQMASELARIAADVRNDATIRAVLLTGTGRAFCTGADLSDPAIAGPSGYPGGELIAKTLLTTVNPMMQQWYRLPVPVVVAVNGVAAGAGVSLALVGDIVTAAESASFTLQFIPRLGIVPDLGATFGLPQRISVARMKGLALLGNTLPARKALEWGLIWDCVEDLALHNHSLALARQLARGPTSAIAAFKSMLADGQSASLEAQLEREAQIQKVLADTQDFHEGLTAFRQKRDPSFHGK